MDIEAGGNILGRLVFELRDGTLFVKRDARMLFPFENPSDLVT